jgi:hypothetical protein
VDGMVCMSTNAASDTRRRLQETAVRRTNASERPRPVRELVVGRGVDGDFGSLCSTVSRVAVPVPFPRFFDERINILGRLGTIDLSCRRAMRGEVGEISVLASMYTDAATGHRGLIEHGNSLAREERVSTFAGVGGSTESASLSEASETLLGLATDYQSL